MTDNERINRLERLFVRLCDAVRRIEQDRRRGFSGFGNEIETELTLLKAYVRGDFEPTQ